MKNVSLILESGTVGSWLKSLKVDKRSQLLELTDKNILLCTSRSTINFQQPDMELSINHEIKSKQLKTVISKTFCCQFLHKKLDNQVSHTAVRGRHGGLMLSAPTYSTNILSSSPAWGRCVVFLGKTLYSHAASLHPAV